MSDGSAKFELIGIPEGFQAAIRLALGSLDSLQHGVERTALSVEGLNAGFGGMLTGLGALAGVAGLGALVEHVLHATTELEHMSERVGIGVEQLQELQYAAKLSGVETEALEKGLERLNKNLGQAQAGDLKAIQTFQDLGVAIRDDVTGRALDAGDVLGDIAEKFKDTDSNSEKARLGFLAFGKGFAAMVPLLNQGRAGIQAARDEAVSVGLVLDREMVEGAKHAEQQLLKLETAVKVNVTRAVLQLQPEILQLTKLLVEGLGAMKNFFEYFGRDATVGVNELTLRLTEARRQLELLKAAGPVGVGQFIGGAGTDQRSRDLQNRITQLEGLLAKKQGAEALKGGAGDAEATAKQEAALTALTAKFQEMVAPLKDTKEIIKFGEEAEKVAKTLNPTMAAAVRALSEAFATWKQSVIDAGKALEEISKGGKAMDFFGAGGGANVFKGLEDVTAVGDQIKNLKAGIAQLVTEKVPVGQIFQTIQEGSQGAAQKLAALIEKYKDQPAILEKLTQLQKQYGQGGEALARDLDGMVRGMANLKQGEGQVVDASGTVIDRVTGMRTTMTQFIDTAEGINLIWRPAIKDAADQVGAFTRAMAVVPTAAGLVGASMVKVTENGNALNTTLDGLIRRLQILAPVNLGAATAPGR